MVTIETLSAEEIQTEDTTSVTCNGPAAPESLRTLEADLNLEDQL